jgi:hypothetical protein
MPDGYLISVGVKADFSELKAESKQAAETVEEMSSAIAESLGEANDAAETSGDAFTGMAEAYATVEAQGIQTVESMNAVAVAAAEQASAAADASAASISAASDTTESMSATALAADRTSAAYQNLARAALEQSNAQNRVTSVLSQYRSGVLSAALATSLLASEIKESAVAASELAAAKTEAAAATSMLSEAQARASVSASEDAAAIAAAAEAEATEAEAAEEDAEAVTALGDAHGKSVSQVAAASGAIREFEGALPIRAVERFMTTSLGLGPVLQAAFPIIGAIALGEVLVETGAKLAGIYEDLRGIKALREDIEKGADKDQSRAAQATSQTMEEAHAHSKHENPAGTISVDIDQQQSKIQALEARLAAAKKDAESLREQAKTANPVFGQDPEKLKLQAQGNDSLAGAFQEELAQAKQHLITLQDSYQDEKEKEAKAAEAAEEKKQRAADKTARLEEERIKKYEHGQEELQKAEAEAAEGIKKYDEESHKTQDKDNDKLLAEGQKEYEKELKASNEQLEIQAQKTRDAMNVAVGSNANKQQEIKGHASEGGISKGTETEELEKLTQEKIGIQNSYYQALEALYLKDSKEWQALENQRLAAIQKGIQELTKLEGSGANNFIKPWTKAFSEFNRAFTSNLDSVLRGQESISRGAQRMASSMLISLVNQLAQMGLKWAEHFILVNLLHLTSTAKSQSVDSAANLTKVVGASTANVSIATSDAAVAAAATLASISAIPVTGPFMAPGMAAAQLATGLGFASLASAAGGWDRVPSDTMAAIHKDEMVLSAPLATKVRSMADGGRSGTTTIHNGGNTFNGIADTKTFKKMLNRHQRDVAMTTRKALRNGR